LSPQQQLKIRRLVNSEIQCSYFSPSYKENPRLIQGVSVNLYFKLVVLSWNSPGEAEKNPENLDEDYFVILAIFDIDPCLVKDKKFTATTPCSV
jgi:hypothetical protein